MKNTLASSTRVRKWLSLLGAVLVVTGCSTTLSGPHEGEGDDGGGEDATADTASPVDGALGSNDAGIDADSAVVPSEGGADANEGGGADASDGETGDASDGEAPDANDGEVADAHDAGGAEDANDGSTADADDANVPDACSPAIPCTKPGNSCRTGITACDGTCGSLTNVANCSPASCGAGSVCSDGACTVFTSGASCPFSNACEKGSQSCTVANGVACDDSGNHEPPGTVCTGAAGANACDGNGNCSCAGGGSCILAGACTPNTYSCATGTAVCTAGSGTAANGSSCNADALHYCYAGVCTPCTPNGPCTPASPDECKSGAYVCTGAAPACAAQSGNAAAGTTCSNGADNACDGSGNCNCAAGGTCAAQPDPCAFGVESCATGTQQCENGATNPAMNGLSCGGTGTCVSGACQCGANAEYFEGACTTCPGFTSVNTVFVDAAIGSDDVCCGTKATTGFGAPCQTITYGLKRVGGSGWTVSIAGDSSGNASSNETYPIELSGGVILAGTGPALPGAPCLPGVSGKAVIEVDTDSTLAQVQGMTLGTGGSCGGAPTGAAYGIYVHGGGQVTATGVAIANVDQGIYIGPNSNYTGGGNFTIEGARIGVTLDGGGMSATSVVIANSSQDGVHCTSVTNSSLTSGGSISTLEVSAASRYAVYVGPGCDFTGDLYLGAAAVNHAIPCPAPRTDNIGLYVEGNGTVPLTAYVSIACMNGDGIVLADNASLIGTPSVSIGGGQIFKNGCAGARVEAGAFSMHGTTVDANHWGIVQQTSATGSVGLVDIAGYSTGLSSGTSSPNTIYCNGKTEPGACCVGGDCPNGANVWNDSALPLSATNDYWGDSPLSKCTSCNSALTSCSGCSGSAFSSNGGPPPDDIDVLVSSDTDAGAPGTIDTTGPLLLTNPACSY